MDELIQPLLIAILTISVVLLLFKPNFVFYVFIACIPLDALIISDLYSLPKILGLLTLLSFIIVTMKLRKKLTLDSPFVIFYFFLAWGALSYFWSADTYMTLVRITTIVQLWILYFMVINQVKNVKDLNYFMTFLFVGSIIFAAFGLSDLVLQLIHNESYRLASVARNANWYFVVSICLIPAMYWVFLKKNKGAKTLAVIVALVLLITSLYTQSRGGLISLGGFFLMYLFLNQRRASVFVRLVVIVLLIVILLPEGYLERFNATDQVSRFTDLWPAGLRALENNFLYGTGLGTSTIILPAFINTTVSMDQAISVHNSFLAVAIDTGLPGTILYMLFIGIPTLRLYRVITEKRPADSALFLIQFGKLLFCVVFAYLLSWIKGGGMEYHKMLWMLVGLEACIVNMLAANSKHSLSNRKAPIRANGGVYHAH